MDLPESRFAVFGILFTFSSEQLSCVILILIVLFIALNLYLLTDSETHKTKNQRSLNQRHCRGRHHRERRNENRGKKLGWVGFFKEVSFQLLPE